jgi:2-keto-3-deoxy-galactonokinase
MAGSAESRHGSGFLSVDWDSSRLRIRFVETDGRLLPMHASDRGAAAVAAEADATRSGRAAVFAAALGTELARLRAHAGYALTGLLIGAELLTLEAGEAGVSRILCAEEALAPPYRAACDLLGIEASTPCHPARRRNWPVAGMRRSWPPLTPPHNCSPFCSRLA